MGKMRLCESLQIFLHGLLNIRYSKAALEQRGKRKTRILMVRSVCFLSELSPPAPSLGCSLI